MDRICEKPPILRESIQPISSPLLPRENVRKKTILVTGGTGFFGRALLRHWGRQALQGLPVPLVTVLTRTPDVFRTQHPDLLQQPWLSLHQGDILAPDTLPRHLRFTHILHAATDSTFGPQLSTLARFEQIVGGTRNLLNFAVSVGAHRFLLTSSGAIYGRQPPDVDRIPEDWQGACDPLAPEDSYGNGKRAAESLCALYRQVYGLETVIARCFAFIGPDLPLDVHFAIGNFIRDALWNDQIVVSGDGTPLRSYLDQQDLAHWLITLLERGQAGRAYNVGADEAISMAELALRVRDILAPGKPVRIMKQPGADNMRNLYVPDIRRVRNELGLGVTVTLDDAVKITAQAAGIPTQARS